MLPDPLQLCRYYGLPLTKILATPLEKTNQLVGNPEDAGSIPSRKALELHFSQLVPVWVLYKAF